MWLKKQLYTKIILEDDDTPAFLKWFIQMHLLINDWSFCLLKF